MDIKKIKESFFSYLKKLDENEIQILMSYLSLLVYEYNQNYTNFKVTIQNELNRSPLKLPDYKSWNNSFDDENILEIEMPYLTSIFESHSLEDDSNLSQTNTMDNDNFNEITDNQQHCFDSDNDFTSQTHLVANHKHHINSKQIKYLKSQYDFNKYPNREEIIKMIEHTGLKYKTIYYWFSKERFKKDESRFKKYSTQVLTILEGEFKKNHYPDEETRMDIMKKTNLTSKQVFCWFLNKRNKLKKSNKTIAKSKNHFKLKELKYLKFKYEENKFPHKEELKKIAKKLNVDWLRVYNWFNSFRFKNGETLRKNFSVKVVEILNMEYEKKNQPTNLEKERIALKTNLTIDQVNSWFNLQKYKRI